jgi:hypothetical protein
MNKITDLKSAPKGGNKKKIFYKGEILKEFFAGGKTKLAYFPGGKDLFTLEKIRVRFFFTGVRVIYCFKNYLPLFYSFLFVSEGHTINVDLQLKSYSV